MFGRVDKGKQHALVLGWRHALCGAVIAMPILFSIWSFNYYSKPEVPILEHISATPDGHGGSVLRLDYNARLTDHCLTIGLHTMSLTRMNELTEYEPLTSSLRGGGLAGSVSAFRLAIHLPPGITPGDWRMINRQDSSCPPIRLSYHDRTSVPVVVRVHPDGSVTIPSGQWFEYPEGRGP